jgi:hypothetical protein
MERAERGVERLRLEMARRMLVGATDGQVSSASGACRPRGEQLLPRPTALAAVRARAGKARASGAGLASAHGPQRWPRPVKVRIFFFSK